MRTTTDPRPSASPLKRWGWFVGLWLGGVATIGGVAMLLRTVLHAVQ